MILDLVCEDAKKEGFLRVEAYPFSDVNMEFQFHGKKNVYDKWIHGDSGFLVYESSRKEIIKEEDKIIWRPLVEKRHWHYERSTTRIHFKWD